MAVTPPRTVTPPNQTALADDVSYRRRSFVPPARARGRRSATTHPRLPSASPEVINALITSLDAISKDAKEHFENIPNLDGAQSTPVAQPVRPVSKRHRESTASAPAHNGGFGVEYGVRANSLRSELPFIDDAAEPPVVRTSKPPSGLSPLTALNLPKQSSGGSLRSYLRSARSSSSLRSKEKEDRRFSENNTPELDASRATLGSRDSSASRQSKTGHKKLRFMGSRERLRLSDVDKKITAINSPVAEGDEIEQHGTLSSRQSQPRTPSPRKPALVESVIKEEDPSPRVSSKTLSTMEKESPVKAGKRKMESVVPSSPATVNGHALIPERGSSLHHPHSPRSSKGDTRRSSRRSSLPAKSSSSAEDMSANAVREKSPPNETEEDKVTRRIRELKEQREKRLQESKMLPVSSPRKASKSLDVTNRSLDAEKPALDSETIVDPEIHQRQSKLKARKMLGLPITPPPQSPKQQTMDKDIPLEKSSLRQSDTAPAKITDGVEPESPGFLAEYNRALERLMGQSNSSTRSPSPAKSKQTQQRNPDLVTPPARDSSRRNQHRWSQPEHAVRPPDRALRNSVREDLLAVRKASMESNTGGGRPASFDSIDLAVDDFLRDPRLSQKALHPQTGRVIMFSEVGDPKGYAVFCCVGMGLTRYVMAFYDELASTLKLRLITPDRPGIGGSEADTDREGTPLSWPDDVLAICQVLKINKFSLLAHSAGAIYALATALRLPQHIRGRVHLLAPWIPPSQMSAIGLNSNLPPTGTLPRSQRFLRVLPTTFLKAANSSLMRATSSSVSPNNSPRAPRKSSDRPRDFSASIANGSPAHVASTHRRESMGLMDRIVPDRAPVSDLPTSPASPDAHQHTTGGRGRSMSAVERERRQRFDGRLTPAVWALATAGANPAVDLLVCLERGRAIGFRYVDVTRSVVIHHGRGDTRVPLENVRWLGGTMRKCEVRELEGEGHGLMASAAVMSEVLTEIAKEWEEWTRAARGGKGERRRE
ncbi:MAG: hypothetical protein M1822_007909 [Bathelium mastoideum]|nr:MAG: hypothetical protein M1822_007909 [Bathelium mastoideum]